VAGDIGNLSVSIPWTQLKNQPVKIVIDDVYVLARARPQGKVDLEEDARIEQATKQEKLKSAEAVDNAASQVGAVAGDEGMLSYDLFTRNADSQESSLIWVRSYRK